jgi:hypothetical protein
MEQKMTFNKKLSVILTAAYVTTILVFLFLTAINFWGD